ncbi:hypothetical protein VF13_36605 [Nostoc linckia z16]|nr:hypothetical protein VF13_36605 [Nostoc linckia z16]
MNSHCLNCSNPVEHNFCPQCGQKASTHRYSMVHFVEHDLIHSVWHVDKGIFFTIKELFTRPGHSVREYIQGKRVNYFSFITLILLLLAISSFLTPYLKIKMSELVSAESRQVMNEFERFTTSNPKLVMLIQIPIFSLFSYIWFRRAKLNYSEHLVLESYRIIPQLLIGIAFSIVCTATANISVLSIIYFGVITVLSFLYTVWFYYQFFSGYNYSKTQLIVRSIMIQVSYLLLSLVIGIVIGIITTINSTH